VGLFENYVFAWLLELTTGSETFANERREAIRDAHGEVLEIGFGTGLSLPLYPPAVSRLTVVDPAEMLPKKVARRIAAAPFPVRHITVKAEQLPLADQSFDCVVSTLTLCTIPDAVEALREVRRVLKPGGSFLFLEHGRSDDPRVARWQDRLNPIQRIVGAGCNLNRQIDSLIAQSGLEISRLDRHVMPKAPRTHAEMYRGAATRKPL
jgi:ubiquinone/menaquinone biosynthesis C-methylase UbiE